ncbi:BamA/TamA family outer membrane protein [bacterium]|nr:BamA/TamA family outer membrane protein [bacterium]
MGPREAAFGLLALALAGCNHPISRGSVADFFAKDFELPDYRHDRDTLSRERHEIQPSEAAAMAGDGAGALAGGHGDGTWRLAAAAMDGGAATFVAYEYSHATHEEPLPETYTGLELALPVIAVDPNSGITIGILPISIFSEKDRITNIFPPQVTYNAIDGAGALFRMRRYYTTESTLSIDAGSTMNGAHTYDFQYSQFSIGPAHLLFFQGEVKYLTDLSARFYGLGNSSSSDDETNYTLRRAEATASIGIKLPLSLRAMFSEVLSSTRIGPGHIGALDSSKEKFPFVLGMQGRTDILSHRFTLTLDTRDSPSVPTEGIFLEGYYEVGDTTLASDFAFQRGGVSVTGLYSYLDEPLFTLWGHDFRLRLTTVGRFSVRLVGGRHVPFYEEASVGGRNTLRGFGAGRFIDKNGYVLGVEERWNIVDFRLAGTDLTLQVAGFLELGRVFSGSQTFNFTGLHFDAGGAARLLLPASGLVGSVDVGISKEGIAPFVDLGYPF